MAVISPEELERARAALALAAPGAGPIERFDAAAAKLGATEREVALREAARGLRRAGVEVARLGEIAAAMQALEQAGAYLGIVTQVSPPEAAKSARVRVSLLGQPGRLVAGCLPSVDASALELGDEVELVRAGQDQWAVRRRLGRHQRCGGAARLEALEPGGLLRARHGPDPLFLRPVAALARELGELAERPGEALGRHVAFDAELGLAFGFVGAPERDELVLREFPRVKRSDLVLDPKILRFFDEELLFPERYPELARSYGLAPERLLIFTGPPGLGKTHAARWLASELGRPLFLISGAELADPWYGGTEGKLRARLDAAAREPEGAVVVWDEAESQLVERGTSPVGVEDRMVSILLAFTDGFVRHGKVLLVLTTNRADRLDWALRRHLRGKSVVFGRPDAARTRRLFELYLRDLPCAVDDPRELAREAAIAIFAEREPVAEAVLRDARRVAVPRGSLVTGALVRATCERAQRLAFVRHVHGDAAPTGILRDELLLALDEGFAAAGEVLTARNLLEAASLRGVEPGEVVGIERRGDAGWRRMACDDAA